MTEYFKFHFLTCLFAFPLLAGCSATFVYDCCGSINPETLEVNRSREFVVDLKRKCNPSGVILEAGKRYSFQVYTLSRIADGRIKCMPPDYDADGEKCEPIGPDGYKTELLPWYMRFIMWFGESSRPLDTPDARWLELVGTVGHGNKVFFPVTQYPSNTKPYEAKETGEFYALANDFPRLGRYGNNVGVLRVTVRHVGQ